MPRVAAVLPSTRGTGAATAAAVAGSAAVAATGAASAASGAAAIRLPGPVRARALLAQSIRSKPRPSSGTTTWNPNGSKLRPQIWQFCMWAAYNRPTGRRPLPERLIRANYAVFSFLLRPVEGSVSGEHELL